jgi:uncharacterized protein YqeY
MFGMENNNSNIFENINSEIKSAMLSGDNLKRDCLRIIVSDIKNRTVNLGKPITDDECIKALQRSAKTHKDSIEQFNSAGRSELSEKEGKELEIIESFLPKMLDEAATCHHIAVMAAVLGIEITKKNFGLIMKEISNLPADVASKIDRKVASKVVQRMIENASIDAK